MSTLLHNFTAVCAAMFLFWSVSSAGGTPAASASARAIESKAQQLLKKMSSRLAGAKALTVHVESTQEAVEGDQKVKKARRSDVSMMRPNALRVDMKGERDGARITYDGKQLALFDPKANMYAVTNAPPTLDATLDTVEEKLDLYPPGADLLFSDPYPGLVSDVVAGRYVGKSAIDGVSVDHLAFEGNEVDWQIWIDDGDEPLPRRFLVTSKKEKLAPAYDVRFTAWNLEPKLDKEAFKISPPAGAQKIQFLGKPQPQEAVGGSGTGGKP